MTLISYDMIISKQHRLIAAQETILNTYDIISKELCHAEQDNVTLK